MDTPSHQNSLDMLGFINSDFRCMGKTKYTVDPDSGSVEWVKSGTIVSNYLESAALVANYLRFHEREVSAPRRGASRLTSAPALSNPIPTIYCSLTSAFVSVRAFQVAWDLPAYGSSKGVVVREEGVCV